MTATEVPKASRRRLGLGAAVVAVLAALGATVAIGVVRSAASPVDSVVVFDGGGSRDDTAAVLYVHVSGAVAAPGLYVLRADARIVDAVAAAGGFADGAAEHAVNLARGLSDGEQVIIPLLGEVEASTGPAADGRVNINSADRAALETLPRIGPALADRIIAWRDTHGSFTSIDDLLAVPGIGDKLLAGLRDLVTV